MQRVTFKSGSARKGLTNMARAKRNTVALMSDPRIRRAFAALVPPTDKMLLDKDMLATSRQIDRMLSRGKSGTRELQRALNGLTSTVTPMKVMGGHGFLLTTRQIGSVYQYLSGLYLPGDTPDVVVPPARRYTLPSVFTSSFFGSGSANPATGKLTSIQMANLAATVESAWAGFYILLPTNLARYGQVSRITFEPELGLERSPLLRCGLHVDCPH